jgi:hypothetical protein
VEEKKVYLNKELYIDKKHGVITQSFEILIEILKGILNFYWNNFEFHEKDIFLLFLLFQVFLEF